MSKIKLLLASALISMFAATATLNAAVVFDVDGSGVLTGAQNVNVNGTLYDVQFEDGTCIALFSGCDAGSDFPFHNVTDAIAAGQALLDQVLVDGPQGDFNTKIYLTNGCTFLFTCFVHIPYDATSTSYDQAEVVHSTFIPGFFPASSVGTGGPGIPSDDLTANIFSDFAVFTPTAVATPEPASLALFCAGLAGLAAAGPRRSKRKDQRVA